MNSETFSSLLIGANLRLLAGAAIAILTLWIARTAAPRMHRWIWAAALLQSLLLAPFAISLPVLEPTNFESVATQNTNAQEMRTVRAAEGLASEESAETMPLENQNGNPAVMGSTLRVREILIAVWLAGLMLVVLCFVSSQLIVQLAIRHAVPARELWQRQLDSLASELNCGERTRLLVSSQLGPLLARAPSGYVIVVPRENWHALSADEREAVLRHELSHLRRGDIWTSLVMRLASAIHWFNPLAWWIVAKFDEAAEWACDGEVKANSETQAAALAGALLKLSRPRPLVRFGVSTARGARVSVRVRRLVSCSISRESIMKKFAVSGVAIALLVTGLVRFHLVAQEMKTSDTAGVNSEALRSLVQQISDGKDPLQKQLVEALNSPAGKVVLADQVAQASSEKMAALQGNIVGAVLKEHFKIDEESAALIDADDPIREEIIRAGKSSSEDMLQVTAACKKLADEIVGEDEATQLAKRFLRGEAGPAILYMRELRKHLRPGNELMMAVLGKVLVRGADGLLHVRPDAREELQKMLGPGNSIERSTKRLRKELKLWADDLANKDAFHKRAKSALSDPLFASTIVAQSVFGKKKAININRILDQLDEMSIDKAAGLEILEEAREHVAEVLGSYDRVKSKSGELRAALDAFCAQISTEDPLTANFGKLLSSDVGLVAISLSGETTEVSAEQLIRGLLAEALVEDGDGLRLRSDKARELEENLQAAFREFRMARRRAAPIRELGGMVKDTELAEGLESMGGTLVIKRLIDAKVAEVRQQNFAAWRDTLFEKTDSGLEIRADARDQVQEILAAVERIESELENNDF